MAVVKENAQKVLERAKAGESFESLVQQYSDDFATKSLGGDLGWFSHGKMTKEFEDGPTTPAPFCSCLS